MDDMEKAKALILDKTTSLKNISEKSKYTSYDMLRHYRMEPQRMDQAAWKRINELARFYDEIQAKKAS